jgi:hypothetical protein
MMMMMMMMMMMSGKAHQILTRSQTRKRAFSLLEWPLWKEQCKAWTLTVEVLKPTRAVTVTKQQLPVVLVLVLPQS